MFFTLKDSELNSIPKLSWLPWVGSNYLNNTKRMLIIGESQYAQGETETAYK